MYYVVYAKIINRNLAYILLKWFSLIAKTILKG